MFYNVYHSKLVVHNCLAHIFREKKWHHAQEELDILQKSYDAHNAMYYRRGMRTNPIREDDFFSAKRLYQAFKQNKNDYKLRIENSFLQIYSNDKHWLIYLSQLTTNPIEFWTPDDSHKDLLEKNVIIKSKPFPFEYKISLQSRVDPSFAFWANNNLDKIKIGKRLLSYIEENGYVKSMYFYVRDEKVLHLINLMIGNSIQRIDKIVSTANIDK